MVNIRDQLWREGALIENDDGDEESNGSIIINWAEVDEDVVNLLQ